MVDPTDLLIQSILFAIFAGLTAIIQYVTGPTYAGLLVPELSTSSLYPAFPGGSGSFYAAPIAFSDYLLVNLVDPAIVLVALAIGLLYLSRSFVGRETVRLEGVLPRVVVYTVLANISVPVGGALLDLAGAIYPVIAGWDGGAWQNWTNLAGVGGVAFSWDNGAIAFIVSFVLFSLVLLLAAAVALRDALLAVLLVLLPILTLAGGVPSLRPLATRAWMLFAEAAFLPCVLVIPLELAVGSPSILLLAGYLTLAVASPAFISLAGTSLTQLGMPSASGALGGGIQRGLSLASLGIGSYVRPLGAAGGAGSGAGGRMLGSASSALGTASKASIPGALPLAVGELLGRGASHLVRHLSPSAAGGAGRFPPVARGGS